MMKKIKLILGSFALLIANFALTGCGSTETPDPVIVEKETIVLTVTFIDSDGTTITKTVNKGETLSDIPTPTSQTGYSTIVWDKTDFTNITESIVVNVVKTPKTYVVNLDANGGKVVQSSIDVTFGEEYTLETPTHDEFAFRSWKYNGSDVALSGTWNIDNADGVFNLVAEWGDSEWTIVH